MFVKKISWMRHLLSSFRWLILLLFTLALIVDVKSWNCICDKRECEALEPSGCPGIGAVVWDPCRCCQVCARTLNEHCGGFHGTCEPGLKCHSGICVPAL